MPRMRGQRGGFKAVNAATLRTKHPEDLVINAVEGGPDADGLAPEGGNSARLERLAGTGNR